jgi:methyl-accepting chemotaxis protein
MVHVGALDLAIGIGLVFVCVQGMQLADPVVLILLYLAHSAVSFGLLARMLAPVRAWQRGEDGDTPVDAAFARALTPFMATYVSSTVLATVTALALGHATVALGKLELLYSAALTIAIAIALPVMLRPMFDKVLLELRLVLVARQLEPSPSTRSVGAKILALNVGMLAAVAISIMGSMVLAGGRALRDQTEAELRGRVALAAAELRGGLRTAEALDPNLELVEQLPPALSDLAPDDDRIVAFVDVSRDEAVAAAPTDDGRWVVARAPTGIDYGLTGLLMALGVMITLLPAALANLALNRSLKLSFTQLDEITRRIADEGRLHDLARPVPLSDDELGALTGSFNHMLDVLDELAAAAASVAEGDLRVELDGSGDLHDAFRGMLARLNDVVVRIRGTSLELASAAAEIQATTREQEDAVDQQSQRVLVVSDAVASLAQSADDISRTATEVLDNAERALTTTDAVVERITELGAATGSISELLELIRDIASRSDLLALNGSLEATRAGEAGRGFALVAAEMRRLAERVASTVADVRDRIAEVEAAGSSTVMTTDDSRKIAESTADAARRISEVTQRQSDETEQVSLKVFEVAEVMIAAVDATRQTHSAAEGLRAQAAELERLTGQFKLRESPDEDAKRGDADQDEPSRATPRAGVESSP